MKLPLNLAHRFRGVRIFALAAGIVAFVVGAVLDIIREFLVLAIFLVPLGLLISPSA